MTKGITAYPLAGYDFLSAPGGAVLVVLKLLARDTAGEMHEQSLPLQITGAQAKELAQALLSAAEASAMGPAPTETRS